MPHPHFPETLNPKIPILLQLFFADSSFSMTSWILFRSILTFGFVSIDLQQPKIDMCGRRMSHRRFGYPMVPVDFLPRSVLFTSEEAQIRFGELANFEPQRPKISTIINGWRRSQTPDPRQIARMTHGPRTGDCS